MSFTVFLGNLPVWVTADDIKGWLSAENLVADAIKVIRNPETQESKGFAFIESPNGEEMNSIIRRFDRAPLEDRLLRANPAQPPKPRSAGEIRRPGAYPGGGQGFGGPPRESGQGFTPRTQASQPPSAEGITAQAASAPPAAQAAPVVDRPPRRGKKSGKRPAGAGGPQSAFAEELAKAL